MALASLSSDVQKFSKKLGLSTDLTLIEHAWNLEVGRIGESARIAAMDNACLVIEVDSHSAMQELSLRRREIVRKLNKHFPSPFIQQITLRISNHGH